MTQVGGLVYLFLKPILLKVDKKAKTKLESRAKKTIILLFGLTFSSLLIIPLIAKPLGREPLPVFATKKNPIKAGNLFFVICNRHYVKPELKEIILKTSREINEKSPGTKLLYLDANFPFIDEFPLLPHLSHDDGKKLDIAFLYKRKKSGKRINKLPSLLGYGYSEGPRKGEYNQIEKCGKQGEWQYNKMSKLVIKKSRYEFDEQANKDLLKMLIQEKGIRKIFIEPHLKTRLGFQNSNKIRFHGCQSVRHDDHIHLQL